MNHATSIRADEDRAYTRNLAIGEAREGRDPNDRILREDLVRAFKGHEDQLAELPKIAEQVCAEKARKQEQREQARALRSMTARVLDELKAEEEAKLRRKAEKIARERLGLSS